MLPLRFPNSGIRAKPPRAMPTVTADYCQHGTRKGGRLQGAHKGLPPAGSEAPTGWLPAIKGNRHLRRGSSGGDCGADGARRVMTSF
ncbi:hypothetical protein GW17_00037500 [Ensete ventricosum]|nr:hypothetical protein GW17_00037500 [Ensete ventricosum]